MSSDEQIFTPRERRLAVWLVVGVLALTAAGLAARQTVMAPTIEQAERVSLAEVAEARPVTAEAYL